MDKLQTQFPITLKSVNTEIKLDSSHMSIEGRFMHGYDRSSIPRRDSGYLTYSDGCIEFIGERVNVTISRGSPDGQQNPSLEQLDADDSLN